jgi:hypothetical protein
MSPSLAAGEGLVEGGPIQLSTPVGVRVGKRSGFGAIGDAEMAKLALQCRRPATDLSQAFGA